MVMIFLLVLFDLCRAQCRDLTNADFVGSNITRTGSFGPRSSEPGGERRLFDGDSSTVFGCAHPCQAVVDVVLRESDAIELVSVSTFEPTLSFEAGVGRIEVQTRRGNSAAVFDTVATFLTSGSGVNLRWTFAPPLVLTGTIRLVMSSTNQSSVLNYGDWYLCARAITTTTTKTTTTTTTTTTKIKTSTRRIPTPTTTTSTTTTVSVSSTGSATAPSSLSLTDAQLPSPSSAGLAPWIVGAIIGGALLTCCLVGLLVFIILRRRRARAPPPSRAPELDSIYHTLPAQPSPPSGDYAIGRL
jgi:hypothetical protein